jgi:hypothetical protein
LCIARYSLQYNLSAAALLATSHASVLQIMLVFLGTSCCRSVVRSAVVCSGAHNTGSVYVGLVYVMWKQCTVEARAARSVVQHSMVCADSIMVHAKGSGVKSMGLI